MSATMKQLEGGRKWFPSRSCPDSWDSEGGEFRIIPVQKGQTWLLISFIHDDAEGEPLTRRFDTLDEAMDYAERI